jgi:hypothetical protein
MCCIWGIHRFVYLKPTLEFGDVEWKPWYAVILQACNLLEGTLLDLGRPQAAVMYHIPLYNPYEAVKHNNYWVLLSETGGYDLWVVVTVFS